MAATAKPKIAHGIARLHPDQGIGSQWTWGPEWALPVDRKGRWVIDRIYNAAIRVEFDEAVPVGLFSYRDRLEEAREALSAEDEKRRDEWLGRADKRESEAFVRQWTARKRREYDMPTIAAGTYVRDGYRSSGVWHIATGRLVDGYLENPDRLQVRTECFGADITVDLGDPNGRTFAQTTTPDAICKRCSGRVSPPVEAAVRQEAMVTA